MDAARLTVALTIWAALGGYTLALLRLLWSRGGEGWARGWWTFGCLAYTLHVLGAFHYFYGWSHETGIAETQRQSAAATGVKWGGGLYLNYLFTVTWLVDAGWWWWRGAASYRSRPRWVLGTVHAFLFFMVFSGTVVFGSGPSRWIGAAMTVLLAAGILRKWLACAADPGGE